MSELSDYQNKYETIKFERRENVLQVTVHSNGGPLQWGFGPHREWPMAFYDIANDHENKAIIFTGTGDQFSGPRVTSTTPNLFSKRPSMDFVDRLISEGRQTLMNFLNIEVPGDQLPPSTVPPGGTRKFRCLPTSCWRRTPRCFRIRRISPGDSSRAMECMWSIRCCWASIAPGISC